MRYSEKPVLSRVKIKLRLKERRAKRLLPGMMTFSRASATSMSRMLSESQKCTFTRCQD